MMEGLDGIVSWMPFVARRRVTYSDCDPAGVVFAGNYYRYLLWAYDLFHDRYLKPVRGLVSMPVKAVSIVHKAPLRPGDSVDLAVESVSVGRTTFVVSVKGHSEKTEVFESDLTLICKLKDVWESCPVPAAVREVLARQRELEK
jgi:acyl-CoA thioesterase FadM